MAFTYERHIDLRAIGEVVAQSPVLERKIERAKEVIREAFSLNEKSSISVSGGKDSVAQAALVAEVAKELKIELPLWSHVSDASFPDTRETVLEVGERLSLPVVFDEAPVSAFEVIGQQSSQSFGKKGFFFEGIKSWIRSGYGLHFVGVRAYESKRRMKAARANGQLFKTRVPLSHHVCHPLSWFTIEEVAGVIMKYEMPIHPIYDKQAIGDDPIRLGYVTSLDLLDRGTAVFLKRNYFDIYSRLAFVYPRIREFS